MNKHSFRERDRALTRAVKAASDQGWTVMVFGTGFYYKLFERFTAIATPLYSNEAVFILLEEPSLSIRFTGGGEIRFIDLTPGQEVGMEFLGDQVTADLIYVIEDDRGTLLPLLQHIVHPIMERSGDHCVLSLLGEANESEFGEH